MKRSFPARPWLTLLTLLALLAEPAAGGLLDRFGPSSQDRILEADQAFQLAVNAPDPLTLEARWLIAPGYYLYRDKFRLSLVDAQGITMTGMEIPPGEPKDDPYFGPQPIFHHEAVVVARLQREPADARTVRLKADYQGRRSGNLLSAVESNRNRGLAGPLSRPATGKGGGNDRTLGVSIANRAILLAHAHERQCRIHRS